MATSSDRPQDQSKVQGEGNYEAGRRYNEAQQDFVESGKVDEAARRAEPRTAQEAEDMKQAEEEGKSHARGEQPPAAKP